MNKKAIRNIGIFTFIVIISGAYLRRILGQSCLSAELFTWSHYLNDMHIRWNWNILMEETL